jgi:putative ABC transport system permease protein
MAGFYPALVLSGFNPVKSLYGRHLLAGKGYISRALVVLQFTLATFLIIATITIRSQFNFLTHFELGYDENNVVQIMGASAMDKAKLDLVRAELMKDPSVANVSGDQGGRWGTMAHINGDRQIEFDIRRVDENLLPLFEIKLIKGRNFSANEPTDSSNFILVNEAFVKEAGWKDPLGKEVDFFYKNKKYKVLGVMKDFHFRPLTEKIGPLLLSMQPDVKFRELYVRLQPGYGKASLGNIEKVFRQFFPSNAYSLVYRVDASRERYNDEAKWKQIMSFGAILTIFISCIGLFGLATLAAEKRRKEIGIRKVLGASVTIIVRKLSIDFLRLVVLAVVIALPIAWWALNKWLENYPYRVAISWWIFALALVLVVTIALLTISFQSIRAAIANPVKSLRSE